MNENNLITCYITKYALTDGIIEVKAKIIGKDLIQVVELYNSYYHKPHWFLNKEDAIKKAEDMRNKKIKLLEKLIEKLRRLKIDEIKPIEKSRMKRD